MGWIGSVRVEAVAEGSSRASAACSAALLKHSWGSYIADVCLRAAIGQERNGRFGYQAIVLVSRYGSEKVESFI